jgi:hypothetical protein
MRTFWLKAGGLVLVAVLLVITVGRVPWSGNAGPVTESTPLKQTQKEEKAELEAQVVMRQAQAKHGLDSSEPTLSAAIQPQEPNPRAERLYQMALTALSEKDKPDASKEMNYRVTVALTVACCREIQRRYPDCQEAEKATELLQKIPEQYVSEHDRELMLAYPRLPKVKKSRPLRRRVRARYYRRSDMPIE